jgi:glucosaminylphosphatidylinositol acyltransferase
LPLTKSAYALWAALQTRTGATDVRKYGIPAFLLDMALNTLCLLFSITTYSSHSILLNILLVTPAVLLYFQAPTRHTTTKVEKVQKERGVPATSKTTQKDVLESSHKPFVTVYRGGMMVITCLAILAVDFKVFPRRFAKAEMWGASLVPHDKRN